MNRFAGLSSSFVALEAREKIILVLCVALVLAAIVELFVVESVAATIDKRESEKAVAYAESDELTTRLTSLQKEISKDIDAPARRRVEELAQENNRLARQVDGRVPDLVTPQEMGDVLRQLVSKSEGVDFISLSNTPVKKITTKKNVTVNANGELQVTGGDNKADVYAHGLIIELGGNFISIMEFVKQVESMDWNFFWESIALKTEEYPYSKVELQISTFSNDEEILKL